MRFAEVAADELDRCLDFRLSRESGGANYNQLSSLHRMSTPGRPRRYHSPARQKQADETRTRIVDAARTLLIESGYEATTIDGIARAAGVSSQTVYAAFGSKKGIVAELLARVRFGPGYTDAVARALAAEDPRDRLRFAAAIARQIYEAERAEFDVIRGAGAPSPELSSLLRDQDDRRRDNQAPIVRLLEEASLLGVDAKEATDVLWMLTSRDVFRMMVVERGWTTAKYEEWLARTLERSLLAPEPSRPIKAKR